MSPLSSRLNAIDLYLVVCIFLVFSALMEYAVILLLLNRKRRPRYDINSAIKKMLHNGDLSPAAALQGRKATTVAAATAGAAGASPAAAVARQASPASLEEQKKLQVPITWLDSVAI